MATRSLRRPLLARGLLDGPIGRSTLGRAVAADPRWLLPLALAAYVLAVTWTWEFPNWQGIPFPPVWLAAAGATLAAWHRAGRAFGPIPVAAIVAITAMLTTDVTLFWSQPLRDLLLYLKAGDAWLLEAPVYAKVPLVAAPEDLSNYPFLYPPVTLPLFGAIASLPLPVTAAVWTAGSVAAVLWGLRRIGFGWRWCLLFLAWPPIAQGVYVGNVAVPLFALFAGAVSRPALLVVPPIFKLYSGIAALWLLRPGHWRALVAGALAVVAVGVATLPLTGLGLWASWVEGLRVYQGSQQLLPNLLYGFGLGRYLPLAVLAAGAVALVVLALRARDPREQLSRLGVATVVASPSLFSHGWLVALPGIARLATPWYWLAFGLTACSPGMAWFLALLIVGASWFRPSLRKPAGPDPWHPLGAAAGPWPDRDEGRASPREASS